MLVNLTGVVSELAKNLVLKALNIDIYDSSTISQDDVDTNFLFNNQDLGKKVLYFKNF